MIRKENTTTIVVSCVIHGVSVANEVFTVKPK